VLPNVHLVSWLGPRFQRLIYPENDMSLIDHTTKICTGAGFEIHFHAQLCVPMLIPRDATRCIMATECGYNKHGPPMHPKQNPGQRGKKDQVAPALPRSPRVRQGPNEGMPLHAPVHRLTPNSRRGTLETDPGPGK